MMAHKAFSLLKFIGLKVSPRVTLVLGLGIESQVHVNITLAEVTHNPNENRSVVVCNLFLTKGSKTT